MKINKYKKLKVFHFGEFIKKQTRKKVKQCLIFGNFGAMNIGDESLLSGQINEIKITFPNIQIVVVSRYPNSIKKIHGNDIKAVGIKDFKNALHQILKSSFVIIGGGGLFNKSRGGIFGIFYQMYFMIMFILLPLILLKPVYILGIGIYKNMNKQILVVAKVLFKYVQIVTVRDFHSQKLLQKHNIKSRLFKDNSYLMRLDTTKSIKTLLGKNYSSKTNNVGLSLRTPFTKNDVNLLKLSIVESMTKNREATYWLYNLDNHRGRNNDSIINNLVFNDAKKLLINVHKVQFINNPKIIFGSFKSMNKFICMRLHSMIFADRLSIPFVGIPYDVKCSDFLQSTGDKSFEIDNSLAINLIKFIKK